MSEQSWKGRTLNGRYQIEDMLGQGGMSAVYRATDPNLRRVVAVKIIHPFLSDNSDFVRRFEAEAAAVARLRHNNIIQVYDFNHDGSSYYIIFEFIPGETLQDWLERLEKDNRKIPVADAIRIAASVADALDYAHQQELVHRDVKPGNVMINIRGEAILMDFGIAKIVGGALHTATGAVIGTARYMSPEQIKGERIDARTDIYSLGVMLFEMLSGQAPFEADSAMTIMMKHVQDPVPDVIELRPEIPPSLAEIIYRALAKNPRHRYATAAEMADALRAVEINPTAASQAAVIPATAAQPAGQYTTPPPTYAQPAANPPHYHTPAPTAAQTTPQLSKPRSWALYAVIAAILLLPIIYLASTLGGGSNPTAANPTATSSILSGALDTPTVNPPTPTENLPAPTEISPTPTPFPEVTITNVTLVGEFYVVQYDIVGFEITNGGFHIHFFFDTTPAREAGRPFSDFYMYGGLSPYTELQLADRPADAKQICALVANPDHTVQGESGNCFDLPAAPEASAPTTPTEGTPVPPALTVRITGINEENGVYLVEYTTTGFTEEAGSTHVHFFFDTVLPENAGLPQTGPWVVWTGPNPFNDYKTTDRPADARQMCALVANPDHTVIQGSGNCVYLPGFTPYDQ